MTENQIKAEAVRDFVNSIVAAHESGFVNENTLTIATLHRVAENHCLDEFGVKIPHLVEQWGESTAIDCGLVRKERKNG